MDFDTFDNLINRYMNKLLLVDDKITSRDQFQLSENLVSYRIDIQKVDIQHDVSIRIPKFVDRAYIGVQGYNKLTGIMDKVQIETYSGTHAIGQQFLKFGKLTIIGNGAIESGQYRSIMICSSLVLDGDIPYIGSYALCVGDKCIVDIQKLKDSKIDTRFLYVKPSGNRKQNIKILCNRQQYKRLMQDANFKYKGFVVLSK